MTSGDLRHLDRALDAEEPPEVPGGPVDLRVRSSTHKNNRASIILAANAGGDFGSSPEVPGGLEPAPGLSFGFSPALCWPAPWVFLGGEWR